MLLFLVNLHILIIGVNQSDIVFASVSNSIAILIHSTTFDDEGVFLCLFGCGWRLSILPNFFTADVNGSIAIFIDENFCSERIVVTFFRDDSLNIYGVVFVFCNGRAIDVFVFAFIRYYKNVVKSLFVCEFKFKF